MTAPTWVLEDNGVVKPCILDAVVREVWTADVIDRQARFVRMIGQPGPPWAFYLGQGDVYRWVVVDGEPAVSERREPHLLMEALDFQIGEALKWLLGFKLTVSEALEAGEQRRCS